MFTGMVEATGEIKSIEQKSGFVRIRISSDLDLADVKEGDSISVDGACLTATAIDVSRSEFLADVSPETLAVTTLTDLKIGSKVNLEKAMRLDSRLGGHLVSGHVDCVGRLLENRPTGEGFLLGFEVDSGRYLVAKGSVAVDGVSLTVNRVQGRRFWVMIIPHTAAFTGLTGKKINDRVNVEFDLIGKYVEKFVLSRGSSSGVNEDILKEHGFM
ncbi:MAG: riboflavin synthase [Desulfomonile tiedjei]|uniref:Riboflavin synthase n=1 Tax=Desulfomonile tiedjei TaxID=2358 RepID=A0A9D6UZV1_9BACT|nr:riboflavin synthase [Desulfomonile tiedjei]